MSCSTPIRMVIAAVALPFALAFSPALADVVTLNFETDPEAQGVEFFGTSEWRTDGGNPGGYLSVTDAINDQRGAIVFPDLGGGAAIDTFSIEADLRVGGGTSRPADGFSFNFARPDDPVLDDGEDWASSPGGEANLPEEGTTTGLAIGFDEWDSGGGDVVGMSLRIDDELVNQFPFPVLNGEPDDQESLQTGPQSAVDPEELGWAHLSILLGADKNLLVKYKDVEVFNEVVDYAASPGRLVFGGRTGNANSYHHIDNIEVRTGNDVGGHGLPQLQAGDANQDLNFDQRDLVRVQVAAKYLTGNPATWGEGDWNGAPGGEQGDPPPGDGVFNQVDIIAALNAGKYLTGPYAAIASGGQAGDGQTSIIYNPSTGEVAVDAPAGTELTSINIDSAGSVFTGDAAQNLGGSFDNDADNNIFKATFGSSFGSLSFGNVAQTGLSQDFVLNDLTVIGSLAGGGDLGAVDLIYVPEPSTMVLLALGIAGAVLVSLRRQR